MKERLLTAYQQGTSVISVYRDDGGAVRKRESSAEFVCHLKASDVSEKLLTQLRASRFVRKVVAEGSWLRVSWVSRDACQQACGKEGFFAQQRIGTYEADLSPTTRYCIENDLEIQRPKRVYLDLETDSRVGPRRAAEGEARILSWALVAHDSGETVLGMLEADTDAAERALLEDLWHELFDFDQVVAWNGDRFDFPCLLGRTAKRRIDIEHRRWLWQDHMLVFTRFNQAAAESGEEKQFAGLNAVAKSVLGRGKLALDASQTWQLWSEPAGREQLGEYNVEDVVLMRDIEAETGYLDVAQAIAEITCTPSDVYGINPTRYFETAVLKVARERDVHFPSRWGVVSGEQYEGAYVLEPTEHGIVRDVHVCDFSSLYPSIILTWNLSPETWDPYVVLSNAAGRPSYLAHAPVVRRAIPPGYCATPNDRAFHNDAEGILPAVLSEFLRLRKFWELEKAKHAPGTPLWKEADRRSSGYKIGANSGYGVVGSPWSRLHVSEVAESVTTAGSWLLKMTLEAMGSDRWKIDPFYGDTDSGFGKGCTDDHFRSFVAWCNAELYPAAVAARGCKTNHIKLAYEKKFDRIVILSKKTYAGRYAHYKGKPADENSKPEIKGLEYKRGDTARLAREAQAQLLDLMLGGGVYPMEEPRKRVEHCEEDPAVFAALVERWRDRVLWGELAVGDVLLSKRLGKPLAEYRRLVKRDGTGAALPPHVEVALVMHKQGLDTSEGTKIQYVVMDGSSPIKAVPVADYQGGCDRAYVWENLVYPAMQRILVAAFPRGQWRDYEKAPRPGLAVEKFCRWLNAPARMKVMKASEARALAAQKRADVAGQRKLF